MTKVEILTQVLARVTGKPEPFVKELFENICATNPKIARGLMVEVPEEQAKKDIAVMTADGPGIMARLIRGAEEVAAFESKTVH